MGWRQWVRWLRGPPRPRVPDVPVPPPWHADLTPPAERAAIVRATAAQRALLDSIALEMDVIRSDRERE